MYLPLDFKTKIAETFYDKTVSVYTKSVVKDGEGWTRKEIVESPADSFEGNVRFDNLEEVQRDYGLTDQIDVSITCETGVDEGSIIGYAGKYYQVIKSIPFDSHTLLIGKLWLLTSSILMSV